MEYIFAILLFAFIMAILTSTLEGFYNEHKIKIRTTLKKITKREKNVRFQKKVNWKEELSQLKVELEDYLYLNSHIKWKMWIYSFCFGYILLMSTFNIQLNSYIFRGFSLLTVFILLIGIGEFIHNASERGGLNFIIYIIKWCIFITYPSVMLILYLENLGRVDILFLTVGILLVYSFLFVKSIIDGFKSYLFQFLNFVFILIIFNLYSIGIIFGAFYYENNDKYNFFTKEEIQKLVEDSGVFDANDITVITIKGIEPFFNFPKIYLLDERFLGYIPTIEHLIGNIYTLLIIGFFVSYSVGMLIENRKSK